MSPALRTWWSTTRFLTRKPIRDLAGNEATQLQGLAVPRVLDAEAEILAFRLERPPAERRIETILEAKAQRTPAQRKISSRLLDAIRRLEETDRGPEQPEAVLITVDIGAEVDERVLQRIRALGGIVLSDVPKYRSIRARIPGGAIEALAELEAIQNIRPADEASTHAEPRLSAAVGSSQRPEVESPDRVTIHRSGVGRLLEGLHPASAVPEAREASSARSGLKSDTTEGDVRHGADAARRTHEVDGTGIGIGILSDGVNSLGYSQTFGDLPAEVVVLPGQEGIGREGTAMLEIVHDMAPEATLYFASALDGQAQFAANIEALCAAGADVIVDDVFYFREPAFQDGVIAQGVNAATDAGCFYFSAAGNSGNLNDGTAGVWEGDFAAGDAITYGNTTGARHDFGGGTLRNRVTDDGGAFVLQWADPLGASANDYDLFLVDADGEVLASSTNTQDGTQDPIEYIGSFGNDEDAYLVVVKDSGEDRFVRLDVIRGQLDSATDGQMWGHFATANTVGVAAVDVGSVTGLFDGTESVRTYSSNGPRRMFFRPDGAAITPDDFSATGGVLLETPEIAAADGVSTAVPGFRPFKGTSAAAPHAAAIAALMLEAAGGRATVTQAKLREAMRDSALDIEASGRDRDSGAGIVMAPAAVAAVAVGQADRNQAPVVINSLSGGTFAPGDTVTVDLSQAFSDPDGDALSYAVLSSDATLVSVNVSGSSLTLRFAGPGRSEVTVRATDPGGLSALQTMATATVGGIRDYDSDNDGLIDVRTLAQLDAMRYDLDGDGQIDSAIWQPFERAFPEHALDMGCGDGGCTGYELRTNLDFDTNGDGAVDADDAYWNNGQGWAPLGTYTGNGSSYSLSDNPFAAAFDGNDRTVANLFVNRPDQHAVGLFGFVAGPLSNVRVVDANVIGRTAVGVLAGVSSGAITNGHATGRVAGTSRVGGLVGFAAGNIFNSRAAVRVSGTAAPTGGLIGRLEATVAASYATGPVAGARSVGGLVGWNLGGRVLGCYATGRVTGTGAQLGDSTQCLTHGGVGGLVGNNCGVVQASYATGTVTGDSAVGGLIGTLNLKSRVLSNHWDVDTSGVRVGVGSDDANDDGWVGTGEVRARGVFARTTNDLQTPTGYTGIYRSWNLDLDNDAAADRLWHFGTSSDYPALQADSNNNGGATWQEFGYQIRAGPVLSATTTEGEAEVSLSWTGVGTGHWTPRPEVGYVVTRNDGTGTETIATGLATRSFRDTNVNAGSAYTYQVVAGVGDGEPSRSAALAIAAGAANQAPRTVGLLDDLWLHVGGLASEIDLSGAFVDPEGDALTYDASASAAGIASLTVASGRLSVAPVAEGVVTVTVTATDASGSTGSAAQRFRVTVLAAALVDYDADDDGLIDIASLAQLDAVRHDLAGAGTPTTAGASAFTTAFSNAVPGMGCRGNVGVCRGYELTADLDFDTNQNGEADAGDAFWNDGSGWEPIAGPIISFGLFDILFGGFSATFDGNGYAVENLTINRPTERYLGLFGDFRGLVRRVALPNANITGSKRLGVLAGLNRGSVYFSSATGQVTGAAPDGDGLSDYVGGLIGSSSGVVSASSASVAVSGADWTGGLVGGNSGLIDGSFATGPVSGDIVVGGLAGDSGAVVGSYATGAVAGSEWVGGLVGTLDNRGVVKAGYATGYVSATLGSTAFAKVGGLVGESIERGRSVAASYSTGPAVSQGGPVGHYGRVYEGALVDSNYWDVTTSGYVASTPAGGRSSSSLQAPVGYAGLYERWDLDTNDDGVADSPWDFGTNAQYPVLKSDIDGDGTATWQEFGHQLRAAPVLSATTTDGTASVTLSWTQPDTTPWASAPEVSYTLYRNDGTAVAAVAAELSTRSYTDTDVTVSDGYAYQVVAVVAGGEAVRSGWLSVQAGAANQPVEATDFIEDQTIFDGTGATPVSIDVSGFFRDSDNAMLAYTATTSASGVATVAVSGSTVTVTGTGAGRATIEVTATDQNGSGTSAAQSFDVIVWSVNGVDYDSDGDGLLEVGSLAQLDAIRHDLDGDGIPSTDGWTDFVDAFPTPAENFGCGTAGGCGGFELTTDLDFDTNGDGAFDSQDAYWNGGRGWRSIGIFRATFQGNGHEIRRLFIKGHFSLGLFSYVWGGVIRGVGVADANISGVSDIGALVGHMDLGTVVTASYATGSVSGEESVGGLVGTNRFSDVSASYAAVDVRGEENVGGLVGDNSGGRVVASYATGTVDGDENAGGLVGRSGTVASSYATGRVVGEESVGGLIGHDMDATSFASYWDEETSGVVALAGGGRSTMTLQSPTNYSGIYHTWNADLDGDGTGNAPWHFGGSNDYPALKVDMDGNGTASWQEFGRQLRGGPVLTATMQSDRVVLAWTAVGVSHWSPAPTVAYTILRGNGDSMETVATGLQTLTYTDETVSTDQTYTYQVVARVNGGEAARSAVLEVDFTPPEVKSIKSDATHPAKAPFNVTITFRKPVTGLVEGEIEVANGSGTDFSGSGATYRLRVTPAADFEGDVTVTVPAGVAQDSAANPNEAGSATFAVDNRAPVLAMTDGATVNGTTLTLTFHEALAAADAPVSAFSVTGGTTRSISAVVVRGATVKLTLSPRVLHGETGIEVDYTAPSRDPLEDAAGNRVASFADRAVANGTPASTLSTSIGLSLDTASVTEGDGTTMVTVTGRLNRWARLTATTVAIEVGANTDLATEGTDYADVGTLTLTIPAYRTSATVRFALRLSNDRIDERDESLTVLGSTTVSGLSVAPSGGVSIGLADNDGPPSLVLSADRSSVAEDGGTVSVTVSTGTGSTFETAQTVQLSVAGTATEGADYRISEKALTLPGGMGTSAATVSATLTGVDDDIDDDGETVIVWGIHNGATVGPRRTLTIADDDDPQVTVSFAQGDYGAVEGGHVDVAVTLSAVPERPVSIPVEAEGADGAESGDFSISPSSLSFRANETTRTVRVSAANDSVVDPGESVVLSFGGSLPDGVSTGSAAMATVTILDADFTFVPVLAPGSGATESETGVFAVDEAEGMLRLTLVLETPRGVRVTDIAGPVVVSLTTRENAGARGADEDYATERRVGAFGDYGGYSRDLSFAPADFSDDSVCGCARAEKSLSVDLFDDRVRERTEVLGMRLARKSGRLSVSSQDITVRIAEDDAEPVLTLRIDPATVAEAGGTSTVTVSTGTGSTFPTAQIIDLELSGTATEHLDFEIGAQRLDLPAGTGTDTSSVTTTVRSLDDVIDDDAETVVLSATRGGVEFDSRTLTIADDDAASTRVELAVVPEQVREDAGSATVRVTATLDAGARAADTAVTVTVGSSGDSAVAGTDYAMVDALTLTIENGQTEAETTFTLRPTNDDTAEGAEQITVAGSAGALAVNAVTLTLNDDDVESTAVVLTVDPDEVREGAGSRTVRVIGMLNGVARTTDTVVTVTVGSISDTAAEGTDYTEVGTLELRIPVERTEGVARFTLRPTHDVTAEGDEAISVSGTVVALAVTGTELVLADDDTVSTRLGLSVRPASVSEGAARRDVTVTGRLDAGARETETVVTVAVGAAGDTARSGTDYASVSDFRLTIPADEATAEAVFTLRPEHDTVAEGSETITVAGTAPGLTTDPATLTLSDNDTPSRVVTLSVQPDTVWEDRVETVTVTAMLDAGARVDDTTVRLTVGSAGDTAIPGTDYERVDDLDLTIVAGEMEAAAVFWLAPLDNGSADGPRTLAVTGTTPVADLRIDPAAGAMVELEDDDVPAVLVMPDELTVTEAASADYRVVLQTEPTADVTVAISGVSGDLSLNKTSLVFAPGNFDLAQSVSVMAADDDDNAQDAEVTLTHRASGAPEYRGLGAELVVSIRENDPSLAFSATSITVPEGETETYAVALATEPTGTVTVAIGGVSGDLSLDATELYFTRGDWEAPQTVTVEAAEDDDASTDPAVTLTHQATDGGYDGINGSVRVTITEKDASSGPGGGGGGAANHPPVVEREIEDQTLEVDEVLELDIRLNFYDRDQRALDYTVASADPDIAEVEVDRNGVITVRGHRRGVTAVTVTAADRREESVAQTFLVRIAGPALVALFPSASDALGRQGFLRIVNHEAADGEIAIAAIDDGGAAAGPVTLAIDAGAVVHFNSGDLEDGNAAKGLPDGVGQGEGDWRLVLESELDFEVLTYIRTWDGFVTAMHDTVPNRDGSRRVAIFNPGSNADQVSRLRLVNPGDEDAAVTIAGVDDAGASPGTGVEVEIPAGDALTLTASELESGTGLDGALGDGVGKWRLAVTADRPIVAMSLLVEPHRAPDEPVDRSPAARRRPAQGAAVPGGVRCAGPPGLRAGAQPLRRSRHGDDRGARRQRVGLRGVDARHRRRGNGALQLRRPRTRQRRQGADGRHGRRRRRLAAGAVERSRHRRSDLYPHAGRVCHVDARRGPVGGRPALGGDRQPGQQRGPGQPLAAGEPGRRGCGGDDRRRGRRRHFAGHVGRTDGAGGQIEDADLGRAGVGRRGLHRRARRRRRQVARDGDLGCADRRDEPAVEPDRAPDEPVDRAGPGTVLRWRGWREPCRSNQLTCRRAAWTGAPLWVRSFV